MESFYSGRSGAPFILKRVFATIEDMNSFFDRGAETLSEVNYGEYVMIDAGTEDVDSGKVYKRMFGGAEYLGQIKGSQGEKGDKGDAATIEVGTCTTGTEFKITNVGTTSHAVFDFEIPSADINYNTNYAEGLTLGSLTINGNSIPVIMPNIDTLISATTEYEGSFKIGTITIGTQTYSLYAPAYDVVTQEANGLMTKEDKIKLDSIVIEEE